MPNFRENIEKIKELGILKHISHMFMKDRLSKAKRSWNMSRIRSDDTKPELFIRSNLHRLGFRFRIHRKDLPGKPDIVLKKYRTVIFVHGCFWHHHENCKRASLPKTNTKYWHHKIFNNRDRDTRNKEILEKLGWNVIVVWECKIKSNSIEELLIELNQRKRIIEKRSNL